MQGSATFCLLPFAFCLLPSAFCLLPFAFCLLPSAFHSGIFPAASSSSHWSISGQSTAQVPKSAMWE